VGPRKTADNIGQSHRMTSDMRHEADPFPGTLWATVQESLARAAGQALGRYGAEGAVHTPIALDSPVCALMRSHPEAGARCVEQCDGGVREALESGRTRLFKCHAGLAVFITRAGTGVSGDIGGDLGGAPPERHGPGAVLLGGRVFLGYDDLHAFRAYAGELGLDAEAVAGLIPAIRMAELPAVRAFAEQARAAAAAVVGLERERDAVRAQADRLRYLLEVFAALEKERPAEVPRAVLHGLGILLGAPAGLVLMPSGEEDGRLVPTAVFSGNGAAFTGDDLAGTRVDARAGWLQPALADRTPVRHDGAHDLANAGFPAPASTVDAFPLGSGDGPVLVALLNTPLTPEDRAAVAVFCRHAALLLERAELWERGERGERETENARSAQAPAGAVEPDDVPAEPAPVPWETGDADVLCAGILRRAAASVEAEHGSVMLLDAAEERLRVRAVHGVDLKYLEYIRIRPGEGIAGGVFASGRPLVVADIARDEGLKSGMRARYRTRSFVSLPIRLGERPLGVINLSDKRGGAAFSRGDLRHLVPVAQQAALALERIEALKKSEELKKASMTDYLTGLLNRAAFDRRLAEEVERAQRYPFASPLSLLVVDIDDFKKVNDALGLFTGDDCIRACAHTLQEGTRTIDSVFRRGGEEFTVILPHTSREAAMTLAERLCGAVAELQVVSKHTPNPVGFTVSMGLATFPDDADSDDGLFQRANQALHAAKMGGKNRVVTLPPGLPI
jgi:diguanylate cyclase (GGDEF)-like protein